MINFPGSILFQEILAGILATLLIGPLGVYLIRRLGVIDVPNSQPHKQHAHPTPLAGGTTIMLALLVLIPIFRLWKMEGFWPLMLGGVIVYAFGLWDDAEKLPPRGKLVGQFLAVLVFMLLGERIRAFKPGMFGISNATFLFTLINYTITIVWMVGITNAMNFLDSMDGLVAGLTATALAFLLLSSLISGQLALAGFIGALFGIVFGVLFYNSPPARFFLGDSGAQLLGFLLAGIGVFYTPAGREQASSWFVPILILAVPIFDTTLVTFSRLRRNISATHAGRDHTYHRLISFGLPPAQAVMAEVLVSLLLDCLAFIALSLEPLAANLIFFGCLLVGSGLIFTLDHPKLWPMNNEKMQPVRRPSAHVP